jgi:hypothetical protein
MAQKTIEMWELVEWKVSWRKGWRNDKLTYEGMKKTEWQEKKETNNWENEKDGKNEKNDRAGSKNW